MILTLTLNPAIDLTYTLPGLVPGSSHRVPEPLQRAGGKGVNVARVLIEQGQDALVLAPVGGPTGAQFRTDLDQSGIPHQLTEVHLPTRRTITLVTPEHTTPLNEAGRAPAGPELDLILHTTAQALREAQVLVCSGSVPAGAPGDLIERVVALARAAGVPVIIDTSGPALLAAAAAGADVLKPNADELAEITAHLRAEGRTPVAPDRGPAREAGPHQIPAVRAALAAQPAARALARRSGALVFASLGAKGMLAVPAEGPAHHAHLPHPLRGNPTGAGDAAVAAIAVALARHGTAMSSDELAGTLTTATAWSAAAVLTPSAGSIADPAPLAQQIVCTALPPTGARNPEEDS